MPEAHRTWDPSFNYFESKKPSNYPTIRRDAKPYPQASTSVSMMSGSQTPRNRNGDPANMFTRLNVPYTRQINEFLEHSPGNVHDRLVQSALTGLNFQYASSNFSQLLYDNPRSVGSSSSMTPALIYQPVSSVGTPSLYSSTAYTDVSTAEESVSTGLIDQGQLASYPLLEDVDGVLVQPLSLARTPEYRCVFWFLSCDYLSRDAEEWETHCLAHFHGEEPPRSVICPLCEWESSCDQGVIAWRQKMAHLAEHFEVGQSLNTSRPDFHLYHHLWQKRLIDDEDLKELKGGNHNLTRAPGVYVRTGRPGSRRERERDVRRQRLQHVSQGQMRPH